MTTLLVAVAIGLALIAWLIGAPWWRRRQRERLANLPLPSAWREELERWESYRRVPQALRPRLEALVRIFLAEKQFVGCNGVVVTDEMRVAIAFQACLLVLGIDEHVFDELRTILVYPDEFVVQESWDEDGIVTEGESVLSGQAWDTSRIILSWRDVEEAGDGYNVVLHEFAHYLDEEAGAINGAPRLATPADHDRWSQVMQQAFEELRARAEAGEETFLDPYGAHDEAEFFAVATETFFELPQELAAEHPALYAELKAYYRLDPAQW